MDINSTSVTVGSLLAIVGVVLTIISYENKKKSDIQVKASDYAVYKQRVESLEKTVCELKNEVKSQSKELRDEVKRLDEHILTKIEEIKDLIINKLKL